MRVLAGPVITPPRTNLLETKRAIERQRGTVAFRNFERDVLRPKHVPIVGNAPQQAISDSLLAAVVRHGDVQNLERISGQHATRKTNDSAAIMRHPPRAARLRKLVLKHRARPRPMRAPRKGRLLQRSHLLHVVYRHRTELQVKVGQLVGNTRNLDARRRRETKAHALVLLRVRKARVDGQYKRGIARRDAGVTRGRGCVMPCTKKRLARGKPKLLAERARHPCRSEPIAILEQPVAREL